MEGDVYICSGRSSKGGIQCISEQSYHSAPLQVTPLESVFLAVIAEGPALPRGTPTRMTNDRIRLRDLTRSALLAISLRVAPSPDGIDNSAPGVPEKQEHKIHSQAGNT